MKVGDFVKINCYSDIGKKIATEVGIPIEDIKGEIIKSMIFKEKKQNYFLVNLDKIKIMGGSLFAFNENELEVDLQRIRNILLNKIL